MLDNKLCIVLCCIWVCCYFWMCICAEWEARTKWNNWRYFFMWKILNDENALRCYCVNSLNWHLRPILLALCSFFFIVPSFFAFKVKLDCSFFMRIIIIISMYRKKVMHKIKKLEMKMEVVEKCMRECKKKRRKRHKESVVYLRDGCLQMVFGDFY